MAKQQTLQEQVTLLKKQLAALQIQKESAQREAQAAQKQAASLRDEIDTETKHLLAKRQEAFDEQESVHAQKLLGIDTKLEDFQDTEDGLVQQIADRKVTLQSMDAKIAEKQPVYDELGVVDAELLERKGAVVRAIDEVSKLNNHKLGLENDMQSLDTQITEKTDQLELLNVQITVARQELATIEADKTEQIQVKDRQIAELDRKIYDKRIEYQQFDTDMDKVRSSLADRQQALDDKDQNLRIREQKVVQREDRIQQNAGLLNL